MSSDFLLGLANRLCSQETRERVGVRRGYLSGVVWIHLSLGCPLINQRSLLLSNQPALPTSLFHIPVVTPTPHSMKPKGDNNMTRLLHHLLWLLLHTQTCENYLFVEKKKTSLNYIILKMFSAFCWDLS